MPPASEAALTRDQISAMIARKAWHDPGFHQRLLADATAVYEQETGQKVPPGVRIKVVADDAHTIHFVIPAKPARAGELSDTDLETVAGGVSIFPILNPGSSPLNGGMTPDFQWNGTTWVPIRPPDADGHAPSMPRGS